MRVTLADIAARAGVSQATVSLVLSGAAKARVSGDTRERVRAAAEALGYPRRGGLARADGVRVVGLLLDELTTTPFAAPLIDGAREEAAARGAVVALVPTGGDEAVAEAALDALVGPGLAGVIQAALITRAMRVPDRLRPALTRLAGASFGAYMIHVLVLGVLTDVLVDADLTLPVAAALVLAVTAATTALSFGAALLWTRLGLTRLLG